MKPTESITQFEATCACKVGRILGGHDAGVARWPLPPLPKADEPVRLREVNFHIVKRTVAKHGGNKTAAGEELGIKRQTITNILRSGGKRKLRNVIQLAQVCAAFVLGLFLVGCKSSQVTPRQTESGVPTLAVRPLPPLPQSNSRAQSMTAELPPVPTNAAVIVRWTKPNSVWDGFSIYHNGQRLAVSGSHDNCTLRGLTPGQAVSVRAASYAWTHFSPANEWEAEDGPLTPMVVGTAKTNLWTTPNQSVFAMRYTWPCAPGVTNVLQSSANLRTWAVASRFRGTNGTATVVLTNAQPFHRVLVQNTPATSAWMTLTQATAYVRLSWPGDGTPKILEREADARTGSYVTLLTNSGSGVASSIQPYTGARYRVSKPF